MQTANPILSRIDRAAKSGSGAGFAYDEGRSAYAAASGGVATDASRAGLPPQTEDLGVRPSGPAVTLNDVIVRTGIIFALCVVSAVVGWNLVQIPGIGMIVLIGAMIATLVLGLVNAFKRAVSPALIVGYAVTSGLMLGGISWAYNQLALANQYQGLVLQAVLATMTTFAVMLVLYSTKIIKVTGKFVRVLIGAMIAYAVIGLASLVGSLFGVGGGWGFYGVGGWGLLLCVAGVLLAAFSLMLDFEAIAQGVRMGLPERESWRMGFGLLVTLVWLYLEILRLLTIIASGRD